MFTKKDDLMETKSFSKTKTNMFTITKFNGSFNNTKMNETASSKGKTMLQKVTVVPDLGLNALTKEL